MIKTTADITIPDAIIDQIIGQEFAIQTLKKAVKQHRNLLMIGPPGIGKSLLAKAYAELLGDIQTPDTLSYYNTNNPYRPIIKSVKMGMGKNLINDMNKELSNPIHHLRRNWVEYSFIMILILYQYLTIFSPSLSLLGLLILIIYHTSKNAQVRTVINNIPEIILEGSTQAQFIDATGLESSGLFGDVLHDPFQSGGLQTPAHKRLVPGAVHRAHQGVLYIDEVGTIDIETQIELLTVLQERKVPIMGRSRESIASSVTTKPIPANFALVLSGNMETIQMIHPALRSRIQGYGYELMLQTVMPDTEANHEKMLQFIAQEVKKDGKIPHFTIEGAERIIQISRIMAKKRGFLTLELRRLGGIVRMAGDIAIMADHEYVTAADVNMARLNATALEHTVRLADIPTKGTVCAASGFMDLNFLQIKFIPTNNKSIEVIGLTEQENKLLNATLNAKKAGGLVYIINENQKNIELLKAPISWEIIHPHATKLNIVMGGLNAGTLVATDFTMRQVDNTLTAIQFNILDSSHIQIICPEEYAEEFKNVGCPIITELGGKQ